MSGFSTSQQDDRLETNLATTQPVAPLQNGPDVLAHWAAYLVATDAVDSATTTVVDAAAHLAIRGDIIRFTSGVHQYREYHAAVILADSIELGETLTVAPSPGDTFQILRFLTPLLNSAGRLQIDIVTGGGGGGTTTTTAWNRIFLLMGA